VSLFLGATLPMMLAARGSGLGEGKVDTQ